MEVCLVRHAIAVERGTAGYSDDRVRPLTEEGKRRLAEGARGLRRLFHPEAVLTSPVLRARQTAAILGSAWDVRAEELEALGTGDHDETVQALERSYLDRLALVGHEPWMSELLSVLLAGDASLVASEFKKGAAALVGCDGPPGAGNFHLRWLIQPGALRAMA